MIRLLVCALVLALSAGAAARESRKLPEAYGDAYLRPEARVQAGQRLLLSAPEGTAYLDRVQQEEWRAGPYGSGLAETLLDAANYFESRGDLDQAETLLRRSVHLTRVNDGLYTPLQLPQLRRLLDFYRDTGQLVAADETQAWLYHLARENHPEGSEEYVAAVIEWADWRRRLWLQEPDPEDPDRLYDVWRKLESLLPEEDEAPLAPALHAQVINAEIDLLYVIGTGYFGLDREAEMMLGRGFAQEQSRGDVAKSQMQYLQDIAYSRGVKRLQSLLDAQPAEVDPLARALTLTRLGDWHIWYSKYSAAAEVYREAWQLLGEGERRREWFAEPLELPADLVLYPALQSADSEDDPVEVLTSFRVSARGRVEQAEASLVGEGDDGARYPLLRKLRSARFRPRLEDGEMVATDNVQRRYITGF